MNMKVMPLFLNKALLFVLLIGSVNASYGESMTYFFQRISLTKADKVLILYTDLDNDGNKEIWVSTNAWMHSRAGYSWVIFENTSNGMMEVQPHPYNTPIDFRGDAFNITYVEELGKRAIVGYHPGGAQKRNNGLYTRTK